MKRLKSFLAAASLVLILGVIAFYSKPAFDYITDFVLSNFYLIIAGFIGVYLFLIFWALVHKEMFRGDL